MSESPVQFTTEELERYARHLVLPEIGGPGQQALKSARVLVVGAGGLGAPILLYLAAAGVGHLTIADDDVVSLSNLQRQVIHTTAEIGEHKVDSAERMIGQINPHVEVNRIRSRIEDDNVDALFAGQTLVIDGCDNCATRYRVADACERLQIPLLTAAVNRFDGSMTTLKPWEKNDQGEQNPRYRDLYPAAPPEDLLPSCEEAGIVGAITGIMGSLLALEAIKEITGAGEGLVGRLLMVDGLSMRFDTITYKRVQS